MISVKQLSDGKFAVIDGMHRVTALQMLKDRKRLGLDYDKVHIHIFTVPVHRV
jgi:hypothetical protein